MWKLNHTISWGNAEKSILLFTYEGRLEAQSYLDAFKQCCQMMETVQHAVDLIVDITQVTYIDVPGLLRLAPTFNKVSVRNHRSSIVVGMSPAARVVVDAAAYLAPRLVQGVRQAKTLEDAYEMVKAHQKPQRVVLK